jgi:hypothetical protein
MVQFLHYSFAMQLDKHFQKREDGALSYDDFYDLAETILATGSEKNQQTTAEFFMKLPKDEVIRRSKIVASLSRLLKTIAANKR